MEDVEQLVQLSAHICLFVMSKSESASTHALKASVSLSLPLLVHIRAFVCKSSSFPVFMCTQDVQQQRHFVLMHVHGAVRLSRGVYVHRSVPRRRHLSQDGGLPEEPTAV